MNRYWEEFAAEVSWIVKSGDTPSIGTLEAPGAWRPQSADFVRTFPELARVLQAAFVTKVGLAQGQFLLYSWDRPDGSVSSWLSPPRSLAPSPSLHPDHRVLLTSFGGIVERSNEDDWWLCNHNDALTEAESGCDATFTEQYKWAFDDAGMRIPIELKQFYSIAREANGNTTFCHRSSGEVILFAPDHAFDYVERFPECPENTFYRMAGARYLTDWVDAIARQWREWIAS
jgi:hypothetical protein